MLVIGGCSARRGTPCDGGFRETRDRARRPSDEAICPRTREVSRNPLQNTPTGTLLASALVHAAGDLDADMSDKGGLAVAPADDLTIASACGTTGVSAGSARGRLAAGDSA